MKQTIKDIIQVLAYLGMSIVVMLFVPFLLIVFLILTIFPKKSKVKY